MNHKEYTQWVIDSRFGPSYVPPCVDVVAHMVLGLAGEAGEVANLMRKANVAINREGCVEIQNPLDFLDELGDVLWYLTAVGASLGFDLDDIMNYNVEKLSARYPDGTVESRKL